MGITFTLWESNMALMDNSDLAIPYTINTISLCAEWEKNWRANYSQFTKDSESTNKIKGKGAGEIYTRCR